MQRPAFKHNPRFQLGGAAVLIAAGAVWLLGAGLFGAWRPTWMDALSLLLGVAVGGAYYLPDAMLYRRDRHAFVRRLLREGLVDMIGWRLGWTALYVGTLAFTAPTPHLSRLAPFLVGVGLGLLPYSRHLHGVWNRMWELYRQEAAAPPAVPSPAS